MERTGLGSRNSRKLLRLIEKQERLWYPFFKNYSRQRLYYAAVWSGNDDLVSFKVFKTKKRAFKNLCVQKKKFKNQHAIYKIAVPVYHLMGDNPYHCAIAIIDECKFLNK